MPENIGNHGLYCPDFDDYAAVALYMQDLGTRIDALLGVQQDELDDFLNAPTIILTNSAAVVISAPGVVDNVFDTVLFNNSTFMTYDFVANPNTLFIGSPLGVTPVVPYHRGAYSIGAGVRMSATGAVTVGSIRRLGLFVTDPGSPLFFTGNIVAPADQSVDQNTGGDEALNVESNFTLTGTAGIEVEHFVQSDNAASTTSIPAGSSFLWVTYNGATDIIEVA